MNVILKAKMIFKALRRPCKDCGRPFPFKTRYSFTCPDCVEKNIRERIIKEKNKVKC